MQYWLFKSEPTCFSIDDLAKQPKQTTYWDGVRNYQARNMLRDEVKVGDKGLFYHSNCTPPGIVGTFEVVSAAHPDFTAWDSKSDHYDGGSTPENPRWYMVDIRFVKKFTHIISLDELKNHPLLSEMVVARRGNRLSITPVTAAEWKGIEKLGI
jgi:predicted RNA-binding protein with PUA-like domain